MTYRVIVRLHNEQSVVRTELRKGLTRAIALDKPRWKTADPAQVEVWISEYQPGRLVAGLCLADPSTRPRAGQPIERPGALRPTVAAMMIGLAGEPRDVLLDPCCGAGTILSQALAMTRVTVPGGRVVLLAPVVPVSVMPKPLRVTRQEPVRLLGTKTTLWSCDRK